MNSEAHSINCISPLLVYV